MARATVPESRYRVCSACASKWRLVTVTPLGVVSQCTHCGDEARVGRAVARVRRGSGRAAMLSIPLPSQY